MSQNSDEFLFIHIKGAILWSQYDYFSSPNHFTFMSQPPQTTPKEDIKGGLKTAPLRAQV